ncbi:MAG: tetratricopeptide repeat protein [Desulfovibrio sp.]|jgi:Flp pilus assembly protein TadD|nr:tetratricopeptide repeat protein [Desulfovibrio sp.]
MAVAAVPQAIGHNLSRARALLKRDDTIRAVEAMISGLDAFQPQALPGTVRFEVEVMIIECVQELNRQPVVRQLFESLTHSSKATIPYQPGKEAKLGSVLRLVLKALKESVETSARNAEEERAQRRQALLQKGLEYLGAGEAPRGKASLHLLAEEFGKEKGVLERIGEVFIENKLFFEGAEMLEQAMETFPKEARAYGMAAQCYMGLNEFEKAEAVYLSAIKNFGRHPRTVLNLAKLYLKWNKKEKAAAFALEAYTKDNSLAEAKEIADKYS